MDTEEAFIPHKPDPALSGTKIVYAVRLDYLGKLSKGDQKRLVEANPEANKKGTLRVARMAHHNGGCAFPDTSPRRKIG